MADCISYVHPTCFDVILDKRAGNVSRIKVYTSNDLVTWDLIDSFSARSTKDTRNITRRVMEAFTRPTYVKFVNVVEGVDQDATEVLVATAGVHLKHTFIISGVAPNEADFADSVVIRFPASSLLIFNTNETAVDLLFSVYNEETLVRTVAQGTNMTMTGKYNKLYLRGDGSTCKFELEITPIDDMH